MAASVRPSFCTAGYRGLRRRRLGRSGRRINGVCVYSHLGTLWWAIRESITMPWTVLADRGETT
jgi:hypothetical protein